MYFANKVAIITGASSGIGWALAKQLAAQRCKVGLIARRQDRLETLAAEIRESGGESAWAVADVASWEQTRNAIGSLRQLGPIDLLIANAGVSSTTAIEPPNTAEVAHMFQVNVLGMIHAIDAVLPEMLERKQGHIAGISSLGAYKGIPGEQGYAASKAAMNTYLEGLRVQLRKRGIAVSTICPGFIKTPMTDVNEYPMMFLMSAEEAARRILRALRRRRKVYNFPWQTALLMKLLRWLPDRTVHRIFRKHTMPKPRGESSSLAGPQ